MGIGIFTLNLAANEAREAAITGEYFELRNALFPIKLVELLDKSGGVIARLDNPEQSDFVKPGHYETVRITNGPTAQTVKHFYGTGDAGSRRTSGLVRIDGSSDVSVIDGAKARTIAQDAFAIDLFSVGAAGQYPVAQLWNPVGSGRRIVVEQYCLSSAFGGAVAAMFSEVMLPVAPAKVPTNKRSDGRASVVLARTESAVVYPAGRGLLGYFVAANGGTPIFKMSSPVVINPGSSLIFAHGSVAASVLANVEYFEELI